MYITVVGRNSVISTGIVLFILMLDQTNAYTDSPASSTSSMDSPAPCTDSLSRRNYLIIYSSQGEDLGKVTTCKRLKRRHPGMCEHTMDNSRDPRNAIGGAGGRCCQTCGDPTCLDKLSKSSPLNISGVDLSLKSCKVLVNRHRVLCRTEGLVGGSCCQSCQGIDTTCADELRGFTYDGRRHPGCTSLVRNNPCLCGESNVAFSCCTSCALIDKSRLMCNCRDSVSPRHPVTVTIRNAYGDITESSKLSTCSEMTEQYPHLCGNFGGLGRSCCDSCRKVTNRRFRNLRPRG